MNARILVLAGDAQEFSDYARKHPDDVLEYFQGNQHSVLASGVITIGTFWKRPDARRIFQKALCRMRIPPETQI